MTASEAPFRDPPTTVPGWVLMGRFVKVSHTLFSLPLVFAGLFLAAEGWPETQIWVLALIAAAGARTTAMALNRIIDRHIDAKNPRTADRELPGGTMNLRQAWTVVGAGLLVYLVACTLLGPFIVALSPLPLAVFALYPYLKRFTPLCHFGVGLALGLSPLGGWLAVRQTWAGIEEVLPLGAFAVLWVAGFDIIYATLDIEFDRKHGVHSIPARFGRVGALYLAALVHAGSVLCLGWLWKLQAWPSSLWVPFGALAVLFVVEHRLAKNVPVAFFNMNIVIGFAVLAFVSFGVFGI